MIKLPAFILVLVGFSAGLRPIEAPAAEEKPAAPAPAVVAALPVAGLKRDMPIDFEKEILPFLKDNCLACHNTTKAKARLNLETPQWILHGGDTGPAVVPGKSAESLLFKAAAHLDPELAMPPKDNKANAQNLGSNQLALLKLWIDQGAKGEVRSVAAVNWIERPPVLESIYAVALTEDGQLAACGRGNGVDVYHLPSGQAIGRLTDPQLASAGLTNASHRDLVNALAFNPDGTLLASAGYREVKLWHRPRHAELRNLTNAAPLFALSADRKWIAAAQTNFNIALIDSASGQTVQTLAGHSNRVVALSFSPDNRQLASLAADKTLRLWNITNGTEASSSVLPCDQNAIAWLEQRGEIASAGADGIIRIAAITNLGAAKELSAAGAAVTALASIAGGKELLSGGTDGVLRHWNLADRKIVREITNDAAITAVAVRPDGRRFASAGTNRLVKLWNAEDAKLIAELKGDRLANELVAATERGLVVAKADVEFSRKSLEAVEAGHKKQAERVAAATATNTITEKALAEKDKVFKDAQAASAKAAKDLTDLLAEIHRVTEAFEKADKESTNAALRAKAASGKATETQIAADRALLSKGDAEKIAADTASVASRSRAALDTADAAKDTARRIAEESAAVAEKGRAYADAVIADSEMKAKLAVAARAAADKTIEEVVALAFAAGQLKPAYDKTLAEAPEKRKAATNTVESAEKALAAADKEFQRAQTRKSVTAHELELAEQAQKRAAGTLEEAKSLLAAAESNQKKTEADLDRLKKAATEAEQPSRSLAFSPDGRTLATCGDDARVHTWSGDTGAPFDVLPRAAPGSALAFLDAATLAAARGAEIVLWNLNPAWTLERTLGTGGIDSTLSDRVNAVRFSPDGRTLATGGGEPTRSGEIKLWNVADGKLLRDFPTVHSDAVLALDFSPDSKSLASSSADRFARVVDLASGKVVKSFEGHTSYVLGVAWKRDSRTLASAGADNVIKVWDFTTGERRKNIEGATKEVTSIAFVGATGEAVAASGDGQVRMLRENGEVVRSFEGAAEFLSATAVTPDGLRVVAGGQDGVLHLWNGATKEKLAAFAPPH